MGSIPANSDAQNVPSFCRWRFEMKGSPCSLSPQVEWAPRAAAGEGEGVAGAFGFSRILACDSARNRRSIHRLIDSCSRLKFFSISLRTAVWRRALKYSVPLPIGCDCMSSGFIFASPAPLRKIVSTASTASVIEKPASKSAMESAGKYFLPSSMPRMAKLINGTTT